MKILIAEDDFASSMYMLRFLSQYGECDRTIDGIETVDAFLMALDENKPYDLICLDIMMPKLDGMRVLKIIRNIELQRGIEEFDKVKVIVTTALNEKNTFNNSLSIGCEGYIPKPIDMKKFTELMESIGLISQ